MIPHTMCKKNPIPKNECQFQLNEMKLRAKKTLLND